MIKIKTLLIALAPLFAFSLQGQLLQDVAEPTENALVYALPSTSFVAEVTYTRTNKQKGPFAQYAKEMLGFEPAISENGTSYQIVGAEIQPVIHFDVNQLYIISPDKSELDFAAIEKLTSKGLIVTDFENVAIPLSRAMEHAYQQASATYLPYEGILKDQIDTVFKREFRDSNWVQVPYYERVYSVKKERDKAKEAADLLLGLHDNLVKASSRLNPEDEYPTDISESLYAQTLNLIDHYRSLFEGRVQTDTFVFSAIVTPETGKEEYTVCYFSEERGIVDDKRNAYEVQLVARDPGMNEGTASKDQLRKLAKFPGRIHYRMPAIMDVSIEMEKTVLARGHFSAHQLGNMLTLPARMVIKK
jgi:hypothetical protein